MYYEYFGLKQAPFKITPDTSLFFPGGNRGAVLEALIYAITQGEGIVKVVGEVGTGKTMLCRMLEIELPDNVEVVYLANPSLSPENILHAIAFELKLDVTETDNRLKVMNELQNYLLGRHADNRQIVVFVEEAQGMPIATLEEIRLLSNLETTQNKLLQMVLFGQPELDQMISKREIRQLKERITYSFQLTPFKENDIKDYLNSRMRTCGYRSADVFSVSAIKTIARYSKGLLRRINILADKALLAAYARNTHKVTSSHVKIAARDSEFIKNRVMLSPIFIFMAIFISLVSLTGMYFPEKLNQGYYEILSVFDAYESLVNDQASEELISGEPIHELLNSGQISSESENIKAISVLENDTWEAQSGTMYLSGDNEIYPASGSMQKAQSLSVEIERVQLLETDALTLNTTVSKSEGLPLAPSEPIALGLADKEFEYLKKQLLEIQPEVDLEGKSGRVCGKCASIIFRPILIE